MYILITDWQDHWKKINGQSTTYSTHMIRTSNPIRAAEALFIEIDRNGLPIKGWFGRVSNIKEDGTKTRFTVSLGRIAGPAEIASFAGGKSRWIESDVPSTALPGQSKSLDPTGAFRPPFFAEIDETRDPGRFEELTHFLLRLLGIHNTHKFPPGDQAGKPDGFFKFGNLAVVYDATLSRQFEEKKQQQIDNYCMLLLKGTLQVTPTITELVKNHQKQVWIISRGASRVLKTISDTEAVPIKEVWVRELMQIYDERLEDNFTEDKLERRLLSIGHA